MALTAGKQRNCRWLRQSRSQGRDPGSPGRCVLQGPCPGAEAGVESDRRLAGIADRALDLFEIACREVVPLLQVPPLRGGFAGRVTRNRVELGCKLSDELGQLVLPPAD